MQVVILLFITAFVVQAHAQVSVGIPGINDVFAPSNPVSVQVSDIDCYKSSFWSVSGQGNIIEWNLINGVIYYVDTIFQNSPITSIAFADSMNPSTIPNTFYGSNGISLMYYDGANWQTTLTPTGSHWIGNCGAFQNYLFYTYMSSNGTNHNSLTHIIYRYDGVGLTLIDSLAAGRNYALADLAIDELGNIWTMTGVITQADKLVQYSPTGNLLHAYPMNLNTVHAYGSFLINGIFYVGFGSSNPVYPSSLVAIGVSGNTGVVLNTIPFPNSDFNDLTSCQPGIYLPLSTNGLDDENTFGIFPNPVTNNARVTVPFSFKYPLVLTVTDCMGNKIWKGTIDSPELNFFDLFSDGIYFISIEGTNLSQKIILMH